MLEITTGNCYKCDLETIIDPNNNQYFWIDMQLPNVPLMHL